MYIPVIAFAGYPFFQQPGVQPPGTLCFGDLHPGTYFHHHIPLQFIDYAIRAINLYGILVFLIYS